MRNVPLNWQGIGDDSRTARGPVGIDYLIAPDEIATSLCRPGTAPAISCWTAYRINGGTRVELNDEGVGLDEAQEIAQADADELSNADADLAALANNAEGDDDGGFDGGDIVASFYHPR